MTNSFIKKLLLIIIILSGNAYSATKINLKDYLLTELKYFDNDYCQMTVTVTDNFGNLIKKERLNKTFFFVDDYEEDRKISWIAETSIDKNNPNFSTAKYNCPSTGTVWQSQLLGTLWNDVEIWGEPMISCIKAGLKHKGFVYYKEKQNDFSTKYFSPFHPVFGVVNEKCGDIVIRTKLDKNYKCTTPLGASICEDKLVVIRNSTTYPLSINEAIVAKLNDEEVIKYWFETLQGKSERAARDFQVKNRIAEEEEKEAKQKIWLASPEGKKYLAEEDAKKKKFALEEAVKEKERSAEIERSRRQQVAQEKVKAANCTKATGLSVGAAESLSSDLNVSVSSIKLLRTESVGSWCIAYVDTPKGVRRCTAEVFVKGKDVWVGFTSFVHC